AGVPAHRLARAPDPKDPPAVLRLGLEPVGRLVAPLDCKADPAGGAPAMRQLSLQNAGLREVPRRQVVPSRKPRDFRRDPPASIIRNPLKDLASGNSSDA